jgi:hypothetical protein
VGGYFYEPSIGEPPLDVAPPTSGDTHYGYTDDIPWDWAHRYPRALTAPDAKAYVPDCPAQTVTVAGRDGKEQTVNILRCY